MDEHTTFVFPPTDLLHSLVSIYFDLFNIYNPLLHRPTFERDVREELHLRDSGFGAVLLMVCALAARASNDPRVLLARESDTARMQTVDGSDPSKEQEEPRYHSAGWAWFAQVQKSRPAMWFMPPRLYDLQLAYVR